MLGVTIWGVGVGLMLLLLLATGLTLAAGAYQVMTGRRSRFRVAVVRKLVPATPADFVLEGAAVFVQAVGTFILLGPLAFIYVTSASGLTGGPTLPALVSWPVPLGAGLIAYFFVSFVMVITCLSVAYGLRIRVRYASLERTLTAAGQ